MNMHLDGWYSFQEAHIQSLVFILKRLRSCPDDKLLYLILEHLDLSFIRIYVVKRHFFLHLRELLV